LRWNKSALIALLDQDDGWYPNHLAKLINPFRDHQPDQIGWSYSNLDQVTEDGRMFARGMLNDMPVEHPKLHLLRCLRENMHILPSASLIRREAFESVDGFDERLAGYEDDDLFLRMFCAGWQNVYLPVSLSFWRMNDSSCSWSPRMAKSRMVYARKLIEQFPDDRLRRIYPTRDCIAPKFFLHSIVDLVQASQEQNGEVARRALRDMAEMAPYMRSSVRLLFRLAAPFLGSRTVVMVLWLEQRFLRPIMLR
jgi:hypothetical protein